MRVRVVHIFVLTFAIGVGVVATMRYVSSRLGIPAGIEVGSSAIKITPVYRAEIPQGRFIPMGRGCGNGYTQSYVTDDGYQLAEGTVTDWDGVGPRAAIRKQVKGARKVLDHDTKSVRRDKVGERWVLMNSATPENLAGTVTILWYGGDGYFSFIDAPNLELANEFEQYLIGIDFRSPM